MKALEIAIFISQALAQQAQDRLIDFAAHPFDNDLDLDQTTFAVSFKSTDGTKIKTYKITISEEEES